MYYSLQNYYNTRIETIKVSEKLSKVDVDKLPKKGIDITCLLYTSDAADDTPCVDLGGRRIIKKS
ncbi:hypothetical protein JMUB7540_28130 [Staphylococcus aureus]